jgi:DNA-binding transcriptional ArsR family regulator
MTETPESEELSLKRRLLFDHASLLRNCGMFQKWQQIIRKSGRTSVRKSFFTKRLIPSQVKVVHWVSMANSQDDLYSDMFASLKHPIRRKILRILSAGTQNFSDMQKTFGIESSHLTYHLEGLGQLLIKTEDGKYALSSLGDAAVSMMNHVEEPPKHPLHLGFSSKKWKLFTAALIVGLILLSSSLLFEYQSLRQLSNQYSNLKEEHELMLDVLRQLLGLENSSLTQRYDVNDTIATSLVETGIINCTFAWNCFNDTAIWYTNITTIEAYCTNITAPWGDNIATYSVYNLVSNSTLKLEFSLPNWDQHQPYLSVEIWEDITPINTTINCDWSSDAPTSLNSSAAMLVYPDSFARRLVWGTRVTNSSSYSVLLSSSGRFLVRVEAPSVENATDHCEINYATVLQVENQGKKIPFFVERHTERPFMSFFSFKFELPNYPDP